MTPQYNFHFHAGDDGQQPHQAAVQDPWPEPAPNNTQQNPAPHPPRASNPWRRFPAPPPAPANNGWNNPLPRPGESGNPWTDPALRPSQVSTPTGGCDPWADPWADSGPANGKRTKLQPPCHGGSWEEQIGPNQFIRRSANAKNGQQVGAENLAPDRWGNPTLAPVAQSNAVRRLI